jgi:hypothetical protein
MTERPAHDEDCEDRPESTSAMRYCACSYRASIVKLERENQQELYEKLPETEDQNSRNDERGRREHCYFLAVDALYTALAALAPEAGG